MSIWSSGCEYLYSNSGNDEDEATERLEQLRKSATPVRLAIYQPVSADIIRLLGYNAGNILHIFTDAARQVPGLYQCIDTADKCGIMTCVTFTAVFPGRVHCADLIEAVSVFSIGYRMTFCIDFTRSFYAPDVTFNEGTRRYTSFGISVPESYLARGISGYVATRIYRNLFMEKVHKFLEGTLHTALECSYNCDRCIMHKNAPSETLAIQSTDNR